MSIDDPLKRALSGYLARKKAGELQEAEARKTDAMRQHEYAVARKSILGRFSSQPITVSQECIRDEKAARRKARLDLVSGAIVACPKHAKEADHVAAEPDKITAIRIKGEVLTKTQEDLFGSGGLSILANDAVGQKRDVIPAHNQEDFENLKKDKQVDEKEKYDTYLHGMDEVIDSTEAEKAADEANLKKCVSTRGECS